MSYYQIGLNYLDWNLSNNGGCIWFSFNYMNIIADCLMLRTSRKYDFDLPNLVPKDPQTVGKVPHPPSPK